jgi:hypothetical protein
MPIEFFITNSPELEAEALSERLSLLSSQMMVGGNPNLDTTIRIRADDLFGSDRTPIAATPSHDRDDYPLYKVLCARRGPGNGDFLFANAR